MFLLYQQRQGLPQPVLKLTSSLAHDRFPCLGITEKHNWRIDQYIRCTLVVSTGGKHLHKLTKELFPDRFKDLSQDQKKIVGQKQAQTHSWSINHLMKSIYAIRKNACKGSAQVADDRTLEPCAACMSLLSTHAFQNAISCEPGESKNRMSVPYVYQPPEIGRLYSLGLHNLIEGMHPIHILRSIPAYN